MTKNFDNELKALRKKIDRADEQLLKALSGRMKVVSKIGLIKKSLGVPVKQMGRWRQVMHARLMSAEELGLSQKFTSDFFRLIHREALKIQQNLIRKNKKRNRK